MWSCLIWQVFQTAANLLAHYGVPTIQLELTRTPGQKGANQTCASIKMLQQLDRLGYQFFQVNNKEIDLDAPRVGEWSSDPGRTLQPFPRTGPVGGR